MMPSRRMLVAQSSAATVTGLVRLANFFIMSVLKAANTKNVTALPLPTLRQIKALAGFS